MGADSFVFLYSWYEKSINIPGNREGVTEENKDIIYIKYILEVGKEGKGIVHSFIISYIISIFKISQTSHETPPQISEN